MEQAMLISACLIGVRCQYDGTLSKRILDTHLLTDKDVRLIPVCPEQLSGLPTPRPYTEICGGDGFSVLDGNASVTSKDGHDVTQYFLRGAAEVGKIVRAVSASTMISQVNSPSCSCNEIYDGTFNRNRRKGCGVTVAYLKRTFGMTVVDYDHFRYELGVPSVESDVDPDFDRLFSSVLKRYVSSQQCGGNWNEALRDAKEEVERSLIRIAVSDASIHMRLRSAFICKLPELCGGEGDSDTIRFIREAFREAAEIELSTGRNCIICTYPEGFLDSYLDPEGICSACNRYKAVQDRLDDSETLRRQLKEKIDEATRLGFQYPAAVALSGGKDSVYMTWRLVKEYGLKPLCLVDDLNQQNVEAIENIRRITKRLDIEYQMIPPPSCERGIRRNFLLAGEHFCRLCLRSHLIRLYGEARRRQVALLFFALSPFQCLDCADAINWTISSLNDVRKQSSEIDAADLIGRYSHRAFQGGFERGFVTDEERQLFSTWQHTFDLTGVNTLSIPLVIPFFMFDGYPPEEQILAKITEELDWHKPSQAMLHRTNCKWLREAGIVHRAVGKYHLNYKERATELRLKGKRLSTEEAALCFRRLDTPDEGEEMTYQDFSRFLSEEMGLCMEQLPEPLRTNLISILYPTPLPEPHER